MEFEKIVESLKLRAAEQFTIAYQRINDVHVNFQKRKVVLLQNQSDQMTEIANEYSRDLETSALRQIPESEILKKQAQIQAKFGNYDSAEYLFAISRLIYTGIPSFSCFTAHLFKSSIGRFKNCL